MSAPLEQLIAEREPTLESLLHERDPWPRLYTALSTMLEQKLQRLIRERDGQR